MSGAFHQFDMNGDGHIDVDELHTVMGNLGYPKTREEAMAIAASVDADQNGTIEFDEFIGLVAGRMLKADGIKELQMAFKTLFDNGSGYVPVDALRVLFGECGSFRLSERDLARLLEMLPSGVDPQGRVVYSELYRLECWDLLLPDGETASLRGVEALPPASPDRPAARPAGGSSPLAGPAHPPLPPIGTPGGPPSASSSGKLPPLPPKLPTRRGMGPPLPELPREPTDAAARAMEAPPG